MQQIIEVIKLGSEAVLALAFLGTLWFVLTRFNDALNKVSGRIDSMGERHEQACDLNTAVLVALQQQLMAHDLTVSGLNPAAGSTVTERDSRAYVKYLEVQRSLDDVRGRLIARHSNGVSKP